MNADHLAKNTLKRLEQQAAITEPLLMIDGQQYTAAQLETMLKNGDLLKLDGIDAEPIDSQLIGYLGSADAIEFRDILNKEKVRYNAARNFVQAVRTGERGGLKRIFLCVWPGIDDEPPNIDIIAPDEWQASVVCIEWIDGANGGINATSYLSTPDADSIIS